MSGPNAEGLPLRRLDYRGPVTETQPDVPEQVYVDAARVHAEALGTGYGPGTISRAEALRAAVEIAYRAGYGQGRDDEAAGI